MSKICRHTRTAAEKHSFMAEEVSLPYLHLSIVSDTSALTGPFSIIYELTIEKIQYAELIEF